MQASNKRLRGLVTAVTTLALFASATPAGAQKPEPVPQPEPGAEADLSLELAGPDATPLVGDSIDLDLRISNHGPEDAQDVWVYVYLSDAFELNDGGGCSSDGYGGAVCSLGGLDDDGETSISLTATRVRAAEWWASFSASSSNYDSNYENNYADLYVEPDTSNPADVGVAIDVPSNPDVGEEFTYSIEVVNEGPETAREVRVLDSPPPGVDVVSWSPDDSCALSEEPGYGSPEGEPRPDYAYRELTCDLGDIDAGEGVEIEVTVERVDPYELWFSAWAKASSYDVNPDNDYAYATTSADPSVTSDLSTSIDEPATAPLLGDSFDLTFTVGNEGPAPAPDAYLSAFLPDGLQFETVRSEEEDVVCSENDPGSGSGNFEPEPAGPIDDPDDPSVSEPADGSRPDYYGGTGFNCSFGSLAAGDSVDVVATMTRVKAREQWISSWVWTSNVDPDYENGFAEARLAADTSNPADVGVTIDGPDDADVGDQVDFEIEVTNSGPLTARSVTMTNVLPYGLAFLSASDGCEVNEEPPYAEADGDAPSFYGYREVRCDLGSMDAGESSTVTVSTERTSDYEIWNTAYVDSATFDENPENDFASWVLEGENPGPCPARPAGTKRGDDIAVGDCPVEAGPGRDTVTVQTDSSTRKVTVESGEAGDFITVNVPTGSARTRVVTVKSGAGADTIRLIVAPGATNATIVVRTGRGNDRVTIDASRLAAGLRILVVGGKGSDRVTPSIATTSGDLAWPDGFTIRGGDGADRLVGGYADDRLIGGAGRDTLRGSFGNDLLNGGPDQDSCDGGPGEDTASDCN